VLTKLFTSNSTPADSDDHCNDNDNYSWGNLSPASSDGSWEISITDTKDENKNDDATNDVTNCGVVPIVGSKPVKKVGVLRPSLTETLDGKFDSAATCACALC
jgi:hypothetical protein